MQPRTSTRPVGRATQKVRCFECDEPAGTDWRKHTFTYGSGDGAVDLTVEIPIRTCGSCGFEFLDHEAETLKHEAVCAHLGVLSPTAIRGIRRMHDNMSRASFSKVTGLGEATLNRWENGILIQNRANDRYLRLLASPANVQALEQLDSEATRSLPHSDANASRFRFITVSEEFRTQQVGFWLRPRAA